MENVYKDWELDDLDDTDTSNKVYRVIFREFNESNNEVNECTVASFNTDNEACMFADLVDCDDYTSLPETAYIKKIVIEEISGDDFEETVEVYNKIAKVIR